ncbi:DUF6478 family protein [Primorskyibacter sp. S187A]|uniref:DUF6478 family protein n=1 Tax=Primorskyibacter sp. S187A TaxID=3415130 RepID=UPI003C7D085E
MSEQPSGLLNGLSNRLSLRRWARAARHARSMDLASLREQRSWARRFRHHLDQFIHIADDRLHIPLEGSSAMQAPHNADWTWRPELWRGRLDRPGRAAVPSKTMLGSEITLFHDCEISELTLRQMRNTREADLAPYGLRMDVFRFDGSYLSLVVDLPASAVQGLQKRHLVRVATVVETEKPLEIFARLNVKNGPNTEQIVRELPVTSGEVAVEFDLAYTKLNEKRVEKLWLDLIFEGPEMNQVHLRDLTMSRRPRADL